ncbi:ATP-binding protein [Burkholderia cepacia]|uniref:ATP-binding protein n=1 Tax=Burkholderia cepacia TaxID=292 RepID=UPI00158B9E7B|nr:ATP-binding protein [Burkholderia cepacia]
MRDNTDTSAQQKVYYRPIEAAIRWSGLIRFEARILATLGPRRMPAPTDCRRWPSLRLNTERLFDGMQNHELPYGKHGITRDEPSLLDDPDLTVRHVDLKRWMQMFYPEQKPAFLFDASECGADPLLDRHVFQALIAERDVLKFRLESLHSEHDALHMKHQTLSTEHQASLAREQRLRATSPRGQATYLNIIAGMLTLMLGQSPSGTPYSAFRSQGSIIDAMLAHYGDVFGISQSTLENKFAEAKRRFRIT